jgi:hypothetical protein
MFQDVEASLIYHLFEEIIKESESLLIMKEFDIKKLEKKIIILMYDYMCWNLKIFDTKKIIGSYLKLENFYMRVMI